LNALPVNIPTNSGYIAGNGVGKKSKTLALDSVYIVTSIFDSDAVCALTRTDCNEIRQANCVAKEHFTVNVGLKHSSTVPILMHSKIEYMGGGVKWWGLVPSPSLIVGPLNTARGTLGERCKLPSGVWSEPQPKLNLVHFRLKI